MPSLLTAGSSTDPGITSTGGNDGALTIQTGSAGAKVDAIALAADGTPTFAKPPKSNGTVSMVQLNSANGYGSTNTQVRRFTNTLVNQGSDITYADSAANGASFTINTSGVYAISYNDQFNTNSYMGISLDSTTMTLATLMSSFATPGAGSGGQAACTRYFAAGSVIRALGQAPSGGNTNYCQFTITRVA